MKPRKILVMVIEDMLALAAVVAVILLWTGAVDQWLW